MWKPEHRRAADRHGLRYPSDLSDREWALIASAIPPAKRGGRRREVDVREVLNAIFYVLSTGCQWQALPKFFEAPEKFYSVQLHSRLPPQSTRGAVVAPRDNRQDRRGITSSAIRSTRGNASARVWCTQGCGPLADSSGVRQGPGTVPSKQRSMADNPQARSTQFFLRMLL